jgi:hypothetical protein
MVKLSSDGELVWQQCFGGLADETVYSGIIKKSDNNWVIAGSSEYNSFDVNCNMHGEDDFWVFEIKDTTTKIADNQIGVHEIKVYPNPARDYVVFELPTAATNNNPNNKSAVISNRGAGQGGRVRNPLTDLAPANKPQGKSFGRNSKGVSHASARSQAQRLEMTTKEGAVVVIVNVYGQQVARLSVKTEKTVWDTRQVNNGVYFYNVEIGGKVLSGKIVIQK